MSKGRENVGSLMNTSLNDTMLQSMDISDEEYEVARRVVARYARDDEERAMFIEMVGL